jgi:hypothetical protein
MNGPQENETRTQALARLAERLCGLEPGAPAFTASTHRWVFEVHRYRDGWTILRTYRYGSEREIPFAQKNDLGRFFAEPLDLINFVLGDPMNQHVLEAPEA